ncbi:MAG: ATP-dependent RecD-like DNA helicase [Clostridia bacterium]|nr:ATP-dependent RecD-like DNA helicase [Clostridia bacterium]
MEQETVIINGTVEEVTFRSSESGFCVLQIESEGEPVTAVGVMPSVVAGELVRLEGIWQVHPSFGRQFKVSGCISEMPSTTAGMYRYLASGVIKGIGESTAQKIIKKFGENAFDVIENEPQRLTQIKGISPNKAEKISEVFVSQKALRNTMSALQEYGMSPAESMRAYRTYGISIERKFYDNPYILCEDEVGMSFERADNIAARLPQKPHEMVRIMAGIKHILRHNLGNGHSCVPRDKIAAPAKSLLECSEDDAEIAVDNLISTEEIVECELGGRAFLFLPGIYRAERTIAQKMRMFCDYPPVGIPVTDELLQFAQSSLNLTFEGKQAQAIRTALEKGLLILTGGPGTGKTTTLKGIIRLMQQQDLKIALSAPTGRAAKRITEITGIEAQTIHRLLGVGYGKGAHAHFEKNEHNQLDIDAIIIDEVSMVDVSIFAALCEAIPVGCRIIMVGDFDQLPPVGAGNILQDIMAWGRIETIKLTEIFRQAMESDIITNSHRIVGGEYPDTASNDNDFFFMYEEDKSLAQSTVADLVTRRLPKAYGFDPMQDIQVLCPSRLGEVGTLQMNIILQSILNPDAPKKKKINRGGYVLREGDKVMQIRNNYDIICESRADRSVVSGVFNGDIGILHAIDFNNGVNATVQVLFDDKLATYPLESCNDLELAYAVTVHKSQGSEFPAVVMPVLGVPKPLQYRNLLYTAVTRAKKIMVLVGSREQLCEMVDNDKKARRFSALKYFLEE